ncbi:ABC transporter ATP-binding protein [Salinisphaera hydrothermalis]|uniref:ABC transporter ATP-binding protein n=1 Tax=Salinisphaera hydrothermalis TaxID=563188 RepID=UPI003340A625
MIDNVPSSLTQGQALTVTGLRVAARPEPAADEITIVDNIDFSLAPGEVLALIGETGSGKSTIALSLLGHVRRGCRIADGRVQLGDTSILELTPRALRRLRGDRIAYIAQSAAAAFNPSKTLMTQVIEGVRIHGLMSRREAEAKARGLFAELALPDPDHIGRRYPHEVSGGQLQRVMAAMALLSDPALIVLDEPTTALDVTTQIEVLQAFKRAVRERGATAVYVSHDLAVVAQVADQVLVLNGGRPCELGNIEQILHAPRHDYTRRLMRAAQPAIDDDRPTRSSSNTELLKVDHLYIGYGRPNSEGTPAQVVLKNLSARIDTGGALGVIGESGSGKSTMAHAIAGLIPAFGGGINFKRRELPTQLKNRTPDEFRSIQMVFQSADNALNPAHTVRHILGRPIRRYFDVSKTEREQRLRQLMERVQLPHRLLDARPGALSGGQKQRVNLARALAAEPSLVICDEVTSALDTVVGEAILDLLAELRRDLGLAYLFISHDISAVARVCDDVLVLHHGECVEQGPCRQVIASPRHDYTRTLIDSIPQLRTNWLDNTCAKRRA